MKTTSSIVGILLGISLLSVGSYSPPPSHPAAPWPNPTIPVAPPPTPQKSNANYGFIIFHDNGIPGKTDPNANLHFYVGVASRTGTYPPDSQVVLEVFDADQRILTVNLALEKSSKLACEFDISPKYLEKTRLSYKCTNRDEKGNMTSEVVWVHLKDFADAK